MFTTTVSAPSSPRPPPSSPPLRPQPRSLTSASTSTSTSRPPPSTKTPGAVRPPTPRHPPVDRLHHTAADRVSSDARACVPAPLHGRDLDRTARYRPSEPATGDHRASALADRRRCGAALAQLPHRPTRHTSSTAKSDDHFPRSATTGRTNATATPRSCRTPAPGERSATNAVLPAPRRDRSNDPFRVKGSVCRDVAQFSFAQLQSCAQPAADERDQRKAGDVIGRTRCSRPPSSRPELSLGKRNRACTKLLSSRYESGALIGSSWTAASSRCQQCGNRPHTRWRHWNRPGIAMRLYFRQIRGLHDTGHHSRYGLRNRRLDHLRRSESPALSGRAAATPGLRARVFIPNA